MIQMFLRGGLVGTLVLSLAACSALDVSDPTAIEESDLANPTGAELLRRDAIRKLYAAVSNGVIETGLLGDEFFGSLSRSSGGDFLNRRMSSEYEFAVADVSGVFATGQQVRGAATMAMAALREYGGQAGEAPIGEMFAVRGLATVGMAEGVCPGLPLHRIVDFNPIYGPPLTTAQAFEVALADFDSAALYAADSARILNLAQVGRARALVGLGRFAEAAAAVELIPTTYAWSAEYNEDFQRNEFGFWSGPTSFRRFLTVADQEGGNGLDFVTAGDPRVETFAMGTVDGDTVSAYGVSKYPDSGAPIVVASGIEARLIEAEAALQAGDPSWLTILNDLRATQIDPAMAALDDPVTPDARVDLLFRERAFWLFGTGHRLGDLRRLIARYGRAAESVFPTGPYPGAAGGEYGTATSIPFKAELETPYSPTVTGCTSR